MATNYTTSTSSDIPAVNNSLAQKSSVKRAFEYLPENLQSSINDRFFDATIDQLFSKPDILKLIGYIGKKREDLGEKNDFYIPEQKKVRKNYQFEPAIVTRDNLTNEVDSSLFYEDIIKTLKSQGAIVDNHDRLFKTDSYSYMPPINLDMLVNYQNYFWYPEGPSIIDITGDPNIAVSTNVDTDIIGKKNFKTHKGLELKNGSKVRFINEVVRDVNTTTNSVTLKNTIEPTSYHNNTYIVEGVGKSIRLLPEGYVDSALGVDALDYIVMERGSYNENRWSKGNCWYHRDTLLQVTGSNSITTTTEEIFKKWDSSSREITVTAGSFDVGAVFTIKTVGTTDFTLIGSPNNDIGTTFTATGPGVGTGEATTDSLIVNINGTLTNIQLSNGWTTGDDAVDQPKTKDIAPRFYADDVSGFDADKWDAELIDLDFEFELKQSRQATRPIIQFDHNLELYNYALEHLTEIDYIATGEQFSDIQLESTAEVDGRTLQDGDKIAFTDDSNANEFIEWDSTPFDAGASGYTNVQRTNDTRSVTNNYYAGGNKQTVRTGTYIFDTTNQEPATPVAGVAYLINSTAGSWTPITSASVWDIRFITSGESITGRVYTVRFTGSPSTINLLFEDPIEILDNQKIYVRDGIRNGTKEWVWNNNSWTQLQHKDSINKAPLFKLYDNVGVELDNIAKYPNSIHAGNKIFNYNETLSGTKDSVLGLKLTRKELQQVNDIEFKDFLSDKIYYGPNEIKSYYFWDKFDIAPDTSANKDVPPEDRIINRTYGNNWNSTGTIKQRVVKKYVAQYDNENIFECSVTPNLLPNGMYDIEVCVNEEPLAQDTASKINDFYYDAPNKRVVLRSENAFVKVKTDSVIELKIATTDGIALENDAYFEIPHTLEANPANEQLSTITINEGINHFKNIIGSQVNFTGDELGYNNYTDTAQDGSLGRFIMQHDAPMLLLGHLLNNNNTVDITSALRQSMKSFVETKIRILQNSLQGNASGLDIPVELDRILEDLFTANYNNGKYLDSKMLGYGTNFTSYTLTREDSATYYNTECSYNTTEVSQKKKLYYVFVNDIQQNQLVDYNIELGINNDGDIATVLRFNRELAENDIVIVKEYNNFSNSFVAPTPAAMGLTKVYVPEIYKDNTYKTDVYVLQGHDGSITPCYGENGDDIRDLILLEFEKRIYNSLPKDIINIDRKFLNSVTVLPGKFRTADYTQKEINEITSISFNKWVIKNNVDYRTNADYDDNDPFTWNYSTVTDRFGELLPGHWRAIYHYYYDTDRPHTHPWEMLGFSIKPDWWETEYGTNYGSGNTKMWDHLEKGLIVSGDRENEKDDVYLTDNPYRRTGLSNVIPVNSNGALLDPIQANIAGDNKIDAQGNYMLPIVKYRDAEWVFGDQGVAESAYWRSSEGVGSISELLYLTKPAQFASIGWNTLSFTKSKISKDQLISNFNGRRLGPNNLQEHSDVNFVYGYQSFIKNYLTSKALDYQTKFITPIKTTYVNLAYKYGAFVDSDSLKVELDKQNPSTQNTAIFYPNENITTKLYTQNSDSVISYSGVIVEKVELGYRIAGYDSYKPYFKYFAPFETGPKEVISEFEGQNYEVYKNHDTNTVLQLDYGSTFRTEQQVLNFLIGYEAFLKSQGWTFDNFDAEAATFNDFKLSAKEFLFWNKTTNWTNGSFIALSPFASQANVTLNQGYIANIETMYDGTYNILNKYGNKIPIKDYTVERISDRVQIKSINNVNTIFGLKLNVVNSEHVAIFDNVSNFNDVMYDPVLRLRQERVKINIRKTSDWNGKIRASGFIVTDNNIVPNFDTTADDFRKFYNRHDTLTNEAIRDSVRNQFGYERRDYLNNITLDDDISFEFYTGMIKQKGSRNSINKLLRSTVISGLGDIDIFEELAFKVGTYGGTEINLTNEIKVPASDIKSSIPLFEFVNDTSTDWEDRKTDDVVTINRVADKRWTVKPKLPNDTIWPTLAKGYVDNNYLPNAGYVLTSGEVDNGTTLTIYKAFDLASFATLSASSQTNRPATNDYAWVAKHLDNDWQIKQLKQTPNGETIVSSTKSATNGTTTDIVLSGTGHGITANQFVEIKGLKSSTDLDIVADGNYKVTNAVGATITIEAFSAEDGVSGNGETLKVWKSRRKDTGTTLTDTGIYRWVDNYNSTGSWAVIDSTDAVVRQENKKIDSGLFKEAVLYDNVAKTNDSEMFLNDPYKGFISGVAKENITYIGDHDPARYTNTDNIDNTSENDFVFGRQQVGELWWDTSTCRYVEYEQHTNRYRKENWGAMFPGSTVKVYEWIVSSVAPESYTGPGVPRDPEDYVTIDSYDEFTNQISTFYYFWVGDLKTVLTSKYNRTSSVIDVENIIRDPQGNGITWYAPISDITASNNAGFITSGISDLFTENDSSISFNYRASNKDQNIHNQWILLRDGDSRSVIPDILQTTLKNSLTGHVIFKGKFERVPDPNLNETNSYGSSLRPRKSWFKNHKMAKKVFAAHVNEVVKALCLDDVRPQWSTFLLNNQYIETQDWIESGQGPYIVSYTVDTIQQRDNLTYAVTPGDVIRVGDSVNYDDWKYSADGLWSKIYSTNCTFKIKDKFFTDEYSITNAENIKTIYTTLVDYIFTENLFVNVNKLFFAMVRYVLAEQDSVDWIFKTSYVKLAVTEKNIKQEVKYKKDFVVNVLDYFNEIKPYSTKIRDFLSVKEIQMDVANTGVTDFDNPAYIDANGNLQFYNPLVANDANTMKDLKIYRDYYKNYGNKLQTVESTKTSIIKDLPSTFSQHPALNGNDFEYRLLKNIKTTMLFDRISFIDQIKTYEDFVALIEKFDTEYINKPENDNINDTDRKINGVLINDAVGRIVKYDPVTQNLIALYKKALGGSLQNVNTDVTTSWIKYNLQRSITLRVNNLLTYGDIERTTSNEFDFDFDQFYNYPNPNVVGWDTFGWDNNDIASIRKEQFDIDSWDQDIALEELNDVNATIVDYIKAGKTNTEIRTLMGDGTNPWNVKNSELSLYRQYLDVIDTQIEGGKFSHVSFKDTPEELAMLTVADGLFVYDIDTSSTSTTFLDIDDYGDLGVTVDWTAGGPTVVENGKVVVDEGLITQAAGNPDVELGKITNTGDNFIHIYDTNGRDFYDITNTHRADKMATYNDAGQKYDSGNTFQGNYIEIGSPISVTNAVAGVQYRINAHGNTNFSDMSNEDIGTGPFAEPHTFYATGPGTGSGTITAVFPLKYHGPFDNYTRRRTKVRLLNLDSPIKRDDTTISFSDVDGMFIPDREATKAGLNSFGVVIIGSEVIYYYGIDTINHRILNCKRGQWGTSARNHAVNQLETKAVHVLLDGSTISSGTEVDESLFDAEVGGALDWGATADPIADYPGVATPPGWDSGEIVGQRSERKFDFGDDFAGLT